MNIHHTIIKGAAKAGVILTIENMTIKAHVPEMNVIVQYDVGFEGDDTEAAQVNEAAKDAWAHALDIKNYQEENPKVAIRQEGDDFVAYTRAGKGLGDEICRDIDLEDLFESLKDPDVNGEDEESEGGGSVVPDVFKKRYAAEGHPTHCGDWLAETLNKFCQVTDGKKVVTDLDRLETIAASNDVETARVDRLGTATNGWQGRYRMTVRNMLAKRIAAKGFILVPEGAGVDADKEIKAPRDWVLKHSPKPKEAAGKKATPDVKKK